MQQAVERALDRADYVIASAQQRPPKRKCSSSGAASLFEKLYDIYVEECGKEPEATEELRSNANLLEKLVRRESLACLVVNLHPGGEGYSLMLEGKQGSCSETIRLPYEEGELLEYLDAEELPPALVDLLEQSQVNIFHCGCVIAQVRDYRQCSHGEPAGYQTRHVLLRPTMQTLACDMQSITSDGQQWTEEEKLLLESQLILATAEPLCLDPSLSVACAANRLLYNKQKMNTRPMKRSFRRYSAPSLTRQQELSQCPPPPELGLWASCKKSRQSQAGQRYDLKISKAGSCVDLWKRRPCDLAVPSEVDVQKYARGKRPARCHVSPAGVWPAPEVRDDGVFGYEGGREPQTTEPASTQPPSNPPFCGQRRPWHRAGRERPTSPPRSATDGRPNRVPPESKADAGRLVVRPEAVGQQKARGPATAWSPGPSGSAGPGGPPPGKPAQQPTTTTTAAVSVWSPVLGKGVRHPPLRIRLPWSSGESWPGDSFPPGEEASSFLQSPPPAPAPAPPSLSQKPSVGLPGVSPLPAAALSTGSSSQGTLAPRVPADSQPPPGEAIRVRALPAAALAAPVSAWAGASASANSQRPSGEADSPPPPPGDAIRVRALPAAAPAAASSSQRPPAARVSAKSQPPPGEAIRVRALSAAALAAASSSQRPPATPATPATPASAKSQKSAVELIRVSMFPAGALPTAGSSSRTTATPVTVKSQKSSVTQDAGVSRLPTTTLSPASSSQSSPATPVTATSAGRSVVVQAAGPGGRAQAVAGACSPRQGSTAGSAAPAASKPSSAPSGARPPEAVSSAPPVRVQFFLKSASGLRPVTLLELRQDSLLLNAGQQPEQKVYQLIPQDRLQQALTPGPPQPVPQGSSAQGAASPRAASSAQPAVLVKFGAEGSLPQPQAAVSALAQLGSAESQRTPGQSQPRPLQALQLSPASSSQPQPQRQRQRQPPPRARAPTVLRSGSRSWTASGTWVKRHRGAAVSFGDWLTPRSQCSSPKRRVTGFRRTAEWH
ncbi:putative transcription factor SPT20 homolog-like 2 isoform X1 [Canis lupus familiaris]|uniref:putative transcription factor SPT20 homolog-like 2 isoform X1 n=1 Tax=Canis lupus familiaris TaxID=9615 RepID=UPI0018F7DAF5|nr:putative transcription factor SPT20 homolog-like 2 isoform X1 [Canis lupus familiaris]